MPDPLGLINPAPISPLRDGARARELRGAQDLRTPASAQEGPSLKDVLMKNISDVNQMQAEAQTAIEDLAAGRRDDMAAVMTAKQKADVAFKMLLQVRNKMMDAYEDVKQIRV